jgi:hypothetical protein
MFHPVVASAESLAFHLGISGALSVNELRSGYRHFEQILRLADKAPTRSLTRVNSNSTASVP